MAELKRVSPAAAHELTAREGYTYVDVRSEPEFAEGHPKGAVNVPLMNLGDGGMTPNTDFQRVMSAVFSKDAKIVLGCKGGGRSLRAGNALLAEGFTNVIEQRAGWNGSQDAFGQITEPGWSRVGLPVESGAAPGRAYVDLLAKAKA